MAKTSSPLVSVVLAARDAEAYVRPAALSILRQTLTDLELVVVDDGSTDGTLGTLAAIEDSRLVIVRNEIALGLAGALNRGIEHARGRFIARLDADDVALPSRLHRQLDRMRACGLAVVGSSVFEVGLDGRLGPLHVMPSGPDAIRWHALFSSPFFHPTVVVDREVLGRHGLRYDTAYGESEDYDLWTRVLAIGEGENIVEPLVLYRRHSGQASARRRTLQRDFQRRVALRSIACVAPGLGPARAELAWLIGSGEQIEDGKVGDAADALVEVLHAFEHARPGASRAVRQAAARTLARASLRVGPGGAQKLLGTALRLDPALPVRIARSRACRASVARTHSDPAKRWLAACATESVSGAESSPVRVTLVVPEPTPFRAVLFDRLAKRSEIEMTVLYASHSVQRRTWTIELHHTAAFLEGARIPGMHAILRHDYPVTLEIFRALRESRPDAVVVSGWSTFASQAATLWCRRHGVPYVLLVESNDRDPRPGWRQAVKGAVVPWFIRGASGVLAVGKLARESAISRGAPPEAIGWFANTVDVEAFAGHADRLAARRSELRAELGARDDDVVVLSVARLSPEKGLDTLVQAVAEAADPRILLVLAGEGPQRRSLDSLARRLGVRLVFVANLPWDRVAERYAAADVFALLSTHEPWGVVVNEAAACGLPLVLSDRVGAAHDLLVTGENGFLVPAGNVAAAADAVRRLASDRATRLAAGARSRELMRGWGYEPSIANFLAAVCSAAGRTAPG